MSNADKAGTSTYNYEFATGTGKITPPPPGLHGYDLCWTFGPDFPLPDNICGQITDYTQVPEFRNSLVNFATTGNPNLGVPVKFQSWTTFGSSGEVLYIHNGDDFEMLADQEIPSFQCDFWQEAPYRSDTEA
jgi:carboxylesterase type B